MTTEAQRIEDGARAIHRLMWGAKDGQFLKWPCEDGSHMGEGCTEHCRELSREALKGSQALSDIARFEHDPGISIIRDQRGDHWCANSTALNMCGEWQPTPEAAVIDFLSKARKERTELAHRPSGSLSDEDRDKYLVLTRWFT